MDADTQFSIIAGKVGHQGSVEVTARQLSRIVGAERRGSRIVAEIRSRLARHRLETQPDFEHVGPDQRILVVPGKDHRPPYIDQLDEAVKRLDANAPPLEVPVRTILEWFGVERRSTQKSELIRATLAGYDLETRPDFDSVHVDTPVALVRIERADEGLVNPLEPQPAAGRRPARSSSQHRRRPLLSPRPFASERSSNRIARSPASRRRRHCARRCP